MNTIVNEEDTEKRAKVISPAPVFGGGLGDKPQTSASAFASSGFGALAGSSTSPFGTIGESKPSVFGGSKAPAGTSAFGTMAGTSSTNSPFGTGIPSESSVFGANKTAPSSSFGASASSFGGLAGQKSVFGSALSNGFGASAPKLSSFAAPSKGSVATVAVKPAKAFGAPDSDEDESSNGEDESDGEGAEEEEGEKLSAEDKKKFKTKGMFKPMIPEGQPLTSAKFLLMMGRLVRQLFFNSVRNSIPLSRKMSVGKREEWAL